VDDKQVDALLDLVKVYEIDHLPDGYPAVQMQVLSQLAQAVKELRAEREQWECNWARE
jgi:hypothetical protein